jgi:hypothetical protein
MKLLVVLFAYGILKVITPMPEDPLYLLIDPACKVKAGWIEAEDFKRVPSDSGPKPEVMGELRQVWIRCDIEQFVVMGP